MRLATTAALVLGLSAAAACGQTPPLKRVPLLEQSLPPGIAVHDVKGGRVEFGPGQVTGRHLHPAPVIGVVTQGSFTFQVSGQPARTLATGDAFYEPPNTPIEKFDNASATQPAAISAFYLLDRADQPAIRMLP